MDRRQWSGNGPADLSKRSANSKLITQAGSAFVDRPRDRRIWVGDVRADMAIAIGKDREGDYGSFMRYLFFMTAVLLQPYVFLPSAIGQASPSQATAGPTSKNRVVPLRRVHRTLIEAENAPESSDEFPLPEFCRVCSESKTLGNFWKDKWFGLNVESQANYFAVSLRTSSPMGTRIEIEKKDAKSQWQLIGAFELPATGDYAKYVDTAPVGVFLPTGTHSLRFRNCEAPGANIDYVVFAPYPVSTIRPKLSAGPEKNPLKGFSSSWWREDEAYATVGFQYLEWRDLEPKDDVFDWDKVEEVLDRPGSQGRHCILQFVVDWDGNEPPEENYLGPAWLQQKVGEVRGPEQPSDPSSRTMRATQYNDPEFVSEASEAIDALLSRYRDDPRLFVFQVGGLGFWGEWHTFPRSDWAPNKTTKRKIFRPYLNYMANGGLTQFCQRSDSTVPPRAGMGYTHRTAALTPLGRKFAQNIAARKLWINGPISGTWPPDVKFELWTDFFQTDAGIDFIRQGHYSTLCPPKPDDIARQIPGWTPQHPNFLKMHRQLGYNFRIHEVRYFVTRLSPTTTPAQVAKAPERLRIEFDLANIGIAPFYKNWDVQVGFFDLTTESVLEKIDLELDLRSIGPGTARTFQVVAPESLDLTKQYRLGLRLLQPGADKPKDAAWKLDARHAYIGLANNIALSAGSWNKQSHALEGGWNVLGTIQPLSPHSAASRERAFPFRGTFRPPRP